MKYLAFIYGAPDAGPQMDTPEMGVLMEAYRAVEKTFTESGAKLAGEALMPVETATSIRIRDGKTELMDGPFTETKEQLGGFYMFECETLDEAIALAKQIPTVEYGTIEVRPVMVFE
ncbi:MAG: YciI family protein [Alphaproteobacteria bacterium]|nr:YciI family protein [Alphaproteobacteria bacterium]